VTFGAAAFFAWRIPRIDGERSEGPEVGGAGPEERAAEAESASLTVTDHV
jgi:hypothetical protein